MGFILCSPMGLIGLGGRLLAPLRRGRETAAAMAARVTPEPGQEVPAFLRRHEAGRSALLVYVLDRGRISHEGPAAPLRTDRDLRRQVLWV